MATRPREEWQAIAREPTDAAALFKGHVVPVAALPAVAGFSGGAPVGRVFAGCCRPLPRRPAGAGGGVLCLRPRGCLGVRQDLPGLAPRFGGGGEELVAMGLAAYSPTAMWLAGAFTLFPPFSALALLGFSSLYKGTPVVAPAPESRASVFTLALIACAFALTLLIVVILASLMAG